MADEQNTPSPAPSRAKTPASYRVVVPLVITQKPDGSHLYVYEGGLLPPFVAGAEAKRLLDEKFVEKVDSDAVSAPTAESN